LKKRLGYDIYLPNLLSEITKDDYKRNWRVRLEKQISNFPTYEIIMKELEGLISKKLKHM